ncbi:DJ-1/PfpI family protein [Acerihabitans arboris]|uniref:DJ-1/PfpI family protein n=1 Tax=Acerihabitans arboris TaxID=2691583 RepID=A0A845SNN6_9GAMM|nr:DJ-1/PfpI family protein [Acerihabitans arboris]NDL62825.1 DJ-1/PfpI family protein [Acerihabitans arboris]
MPQPLIIVIPIYPGVTQLDFTGPHQFFCRLPETRLITASIGGQPIDSEGLVFSGLADLAAVERCDILCVPGGFGSTKMMADPVFMDKIRRLAGSARYITSVCTGSLILGAAGLLVGKRAACHWGWRELLAQFGAIPDAGRVVRDGNIITGGGVTAGIDFALAVINEVYGQAIAESIQLRLEYAPAPPFNAGRPETAPASVLGPVAADIAAAVAGRQSLVDEAARAMHAARAGE